MIKLVEIQKIYQGIAGGQHVLKDINLQFKRNEIVAILGKSGCGKTTLLNIIGGLDSPSSGEMAINNKLSSKMKEGEWDEFRNHKIGFVFQSYNLINHLNVLDNVIMALKISGDKVNQKQKAIDVLTRVGLKDHIYKRVNQLSGGQRQRVAIARALVNDPEIILADEPTGALDKKTSIEVMNLIKELSKDKLVIFVTHNKDIANKYATRIIKMSDGRVVSDTNPVDERVTVDLGIKINRNKLGFKDSILYAFKSGFKNKWKTFLTALGLAIGIMAIMLIDGIFTSTKNAIDPDARNQYSRLLVANNNDADAENDINSYSEFEDTFTLRGNLYRIEKINGEEIASVDYRQILRGNLLAVPKNNIQYNEYESNLIAGSLPKNSGEITLSYTVASSIYKFDLSNDNINNKIIGSTVDILDKLSSVYDENELRNYIITNSIKYYYYDEVDNNGNFIYNGEYLFNDQTEADIAYSVYFDVYKYYDIELKLGGKKIIVLDENITEIINITKTYKSFRIVGVMDGNDINGSLGFGGIADNSDYSFMLKEDIESFYEDNTYLYGIVYTYLKADKVDDKADIIKRFQNEFGYTLYNANVVNGSSLSTFVLSLLQFVFTAISSVTLITGAIMLWLLLYVSTVQRKREIGLLRSMGATKGDVCSIFVSETLLIGVLACIIAIILLAIISPIANYIIPNHFYSYIKYNLSFVNPKKPIKIRISKLIWISVIGIFIAFLAGLIPSIRASKKAPIESLRGE